jgi:tetratricopeptide (TPR) repeat protein
MVQHPEVFRRLVELRPSEFDLWWARGQVFANRRQWAEAAAALEKARKLIRKEQELSSGTPRVDVMMAHYLAALRQLAGDEAGCREVCAEMVRELGDSYDPGFASLVSRTCCLVPNAIDDASSTVKMAERAVAHDRRIAWYLFGLGLAHYRAGDYVEAVERLEESLQVSPVWLGRGQNYVVLAMACQQLGRQSEAREWLAKAKASLEELNQMIGSSRFGYAGSSYLGDWLSLLILIPEAEKSLDGSSSR